MTISHMPVIKKNRLDVQPVWVLRCGLVGDVVRLVPHLHTIGFIVEVGQFPDFIESPDSDKFSGNKVWMDFIQSEFTAIKDFYPCFVQGCLTGEVFGDTDFHLLCHCFGSLLLVQNDFCDYAPVATFTINIMSTKIIPHIVAM